MTAAARPWLRRIAAAPGVRGGAAERPRAEQAARRRVVCLPHAGSGTTPFRILATALPPDMELWVACYPAREDRFTEPGPDSLAEVVRAVTAEVAALTPAVPTAIYGHSMGAVVAHEVAYELEQLGVPIELLAVSSSVAPQHPGGPILADLPDEELLRHCRGLGDLPGQEAYDDPELSEILLRALRMDLRLVETHTMRPAARVRAPLLVLHGTRDDGCTDEQALDWAAVTEGPFSVRTVDGDHFVVLARPEVLAAELDSRCRPLRTSALSCRRPSPTSWSGSARGPCRTWASCCPNAPWSSWRSPRSSQPAASWLRLTDLPCVAAVVPAPIQDEEHPERCLRRVKPSPAVTTVIPGAEYSVITAAALADHWGLPGAGVAAARILRHKDRLREHLQGRGIPQPRWAAAASPDQARAAHLTFGGRAVVKPTDRQSSVGVLLLDRSGSASAALRWSRSVARSRSAVWPTGGDR